MDSPRLDRSETSPQAPTDKSIAAQPGPSSPTVEAGARGRIDGATPPAGSSQDGRTSESPSHASPPSGQVQRDSPVSTAVAALELPNGAWSTVAVASRPQAGRIPPEAVERCAEGSPEKRAVETEANQPPAVAEKDRQVWEMSQRASAAALTSPPPPGLLSQALAYIMAQVGAILSATYKSWRISFSFTYCGASASDMLHRANLLVSAGRSRFAGACLHSSLVLPSQCQCLNCLQ